MIVAVAAAAATAYENSCIVTATAAAAAYDNSCIVTLLVCYKQSRFDRGSDGWLGW